MSFSLRQKLRASHVKRWHIVETTKQQTVAEHTFNVMVLCEEIVTILDLTNPTKCAAMEYALHHDLPEVVIGDIPTPSRSFFDTKSMEHDIDPQAFTDVGYIRDIVKLADIMDAILFLALYGVGAHAESVRHGLVSAGYEVLKMIEDDGNQLRKFYNDFVSWETPTDKKEGIIWKKE